jgi:YD repeat-containing protein
MNRFLAFLIPAMLASGLLLAQTNPTNMIRTDLIPASPNAASIGKFGEVPMNLSTGSTNYSIPVFTVAGNELSLPVTLNYSYDGYKPAQPVSWVGLGWSLNAGGVISQRINDKVDGKSPNSNYHFDSQTVIDNINTVNLDQAFLAGIATGAYDSEPDVFSFNFGNYSGKFIKFKGKYYCFPYQKFKITGTASSITIVVDNGTRYLFDAIETTTAKSTSVSPYSIPTYNSSFYLTKITNAANTESITLTYIIEGTIVQPGSLSQTYKEFISSENYNGNPEPSRLYDPTHSNVTFINPLRLSSITSDKNTVTFQAGPIRTDINQNLVGPNSYTGSARTLNNITVTDQFLNVVKNVRLKQSYSGNTLRLDSLLEYDINKVDDVLAIDTTKYQRTAFDYYGVGTTLKVDAGVDHYGFFNGGSFGNILIPDFIVYGGPNRSAQLGGTLSGAMTKIKFPTGGYSTLEYELNRASGNSEYLKLNHTASKNLVRTNYNMNNVLISSSASFNINYLQDVTVHLERTPKSATTGDGFVHGTTMDMNLYNSATGQLVTSYRIYNVSDNAGKNFTLNLPVGDYYFNLTCDGFENAIDGYILYKEQTNIPIEGPETGGLRVSKITSYPITGLPVTKTYQYTYENGFSSGSTQLGAYDQIMYTERHNSGLDWWQDYYRVSNSFIGETYFQGVPQVYRSVVETSTSGDKNLITRTDFKTFDESFVKPEAVRVTQYKKDANNALIKIQKTEYAYNVVSDTLIRALKPFKVRGGSGGPPPVDWYNAREYDHTSTFKYLVSTRTTNYDGPDSVSTITYNGYDLAKTRNLLYTRRVDSKGRQIVSYFKYPQSYTSSLSSAFIAANVLDPVWEQQTWSKSGAGTDSVLISSTVNQYSSTLFKPLKIYSVNAPNITSMNNQSTDANGLYATLLSDSRLDERINFTYDSYGKIIRQQIVSGAPTSYKWGYKAPDNTNNTKVVAECKNALETEFFHENFEEVSNNVAYTNAHTGYKYGTNYTVSWTKPNSRAYLITFFYLSGGVWKYKQDTFTNDYVCSGGSGYDDISVFPADGQITTYTYDPGIGVKSIIDARGNATNFEYDAQNRLKNIRDQYGNIVKNLKYYTAGKQYSGTYEGAGVFPYANQAVSASFTKKNCELGYTGSTVTYTVPANSYYGLTQEEANAKAQADLALKGQAKANLNGTCTPTIIE